MPISKKQRLSASTNVEMNLDLSLLPTHYAAAARQRYAHKDLYGRY